MIKVMFISSMGGHLSELQKLDFEKYDYSIVTEKTESNKDLTEKYSAIDLVKKASQAVGGQGGGGRPDMAQAGGPNGDKITDAIEAVKQAI